MNPWMIPPNLKGVFFCRVSPHHNKPASKVNNNDRVNRTELTRGFVAFSSLGGCMGSWTRLRLCTIHEVPLNNYGRVSLTVPSIHGEAIFALTDK